MSIDPATKPPGNNLRWIITVSLGILAVICLGWVATLRLSPERATHHGLDYDLAILAGFFALDVLALIGLGIWILCRPRPFEVNFLGRWAGKVLLFLGLGLAVVVFFFATCLATVATG
jgi:hypothetical protein